MDCIAIFDDVLIPWDRVFIDGGGPAARDVCNQLRPRDGTVAVQTAARTLSSLEFFCGLAMQLADAVGIDNFLHVQEKLGECLLELEIFRGSFYGSEALATETTKRCVVCSSALFSCGKSSGSKGVSKNRGDYPNSRSGRLLLCAEFR